MAKAKGCILNADGDHRGGSLYCENCAPDYTPAAGDFDDYEDDPNPELTPAEEFGV